MRYLLKPLVRRTFLRHVCADMRAAEDTRDRCRDCSGRSLGPAPPSPRRSGIHLISPISTTAEGTRKWQTPDPKPRAAMPVPPSRSTQAASLA